MTYVRLYQIQVLTAFPFLGHPIGTWKVMGSTAVLRT